MPQLRSLDGQDVTHLEKVKADILFGADLENKKEIIFEKSRVPIIEMLRHKYIETQKKELARSHPQTQSSLV